MREYVWVHPLTKEIFHNRVDYLAYMRERRTKRLSERRYREWIISSIEKMRDIQNVFSMNEMADFLNQHTRLIERITNTRIVRPFSFERVFATNQYHIRFGYERADGFRRYNNLYITDILERISIQMGRGGGRTDNLAYVIDISKGFDNLHTLAALT